MRKHVTIANNQASGDVLMLTAAVRDLHRCQPGKFVTGVRTSCMELWENNPWVTALEEVPIANNQSPIVGGADCQLPNAEEIVCEYPLIHDSNARPVHFLQGFTEFLSERLGCRIVPMEFKGDIHLSEEERSRPSPVAEVFGFEGPYWIVVAGGKRDYTIKWWSPERWQAVVDAFEGRIQFVQVGSLEDAHPLLDGVLDMRGKTTIRELIRLVYRASGVVSPVTFLMHLSAAVECAPGMPESRPCVVVAGGREAPHWEAYPTHQFIHTVGSLDCCRTGGCWRSRTVPLGDGDVKDRPKNLCVDVVRRDTEVLPRCMEMISARAVIERIELYLQSKPI